MVLFSEDPVGFGAQTPRAWIILQLRETGTFCSGPSGPRAAGTLAEHPFRSYVPCGIWVDPNAPTTPTFQFPAGDNREDSPISETHTREDNPISELTLAPTVLLSCYRIYSSIRPVRNKRRTVGAHPACRLIQRYLGPTPDSKTGLPSTKERTSGFHVSSHRTNVRLVHTATRKSPLQKSWEDARP